MKKVLHICYTVKQELLHTSNQHYFEQNFIHFSLSLLISHVCKKCSHSQFFDKNRPNKLKTGN